MPSASSDSSSGSDSPSAVHQLDDLLDRLGNGDGVEPDLAAVVADNLGEDLEGLFPTMKLLAEIGRTSDSNAATESQGLDLRDVTLGDFKIQREIGRGGMGIVFEAVQLSLDRRVALKILPIASTLDPKLLARFEREAQAAGTLEHPNIVRAYGRGEERGIYYLAMQFIPGGDLAQFMRCQRSLGSANGFRKRVVADASTDEFDVSGATTSHHEGETRPPSSSAGSLKGNYYRQVARVGMQAAEAIQYAHEQGVIHRDIKPSNLLLDESGDVWIADFGLATLETAPPVTATGKAIGTLRYSSPEQLRGGRGYDVRVDVYSLGATLYELATLRPPFVSEEPGLLLQEILQVEPPRPRKVAPKIPLDLESVILKAMSKEPRHRYQTALELAIDLQRFSRNEPVQAERPTVIGRSVRWVQRNRLVSLLLTALALLVTSGVVGTAAHFAQQNELLGELDKSNKRLTKTLAGLNNSLDQERKLRSHVKIGEQAAQERFYVADITNILRVAEAGHFDLVRDRLQRHVPQAGGQDRRGFLWRYLRALCNKVEVTLDKHEHEVLSSALAPRRRLLVTADKRGKIFVWNTVKWEQQHTLSFSGEVCDLEFSPDEELLALCGTRGLIQLYDAQTWELKQTILGHEMTAKGLEFTPDGKTLISCARSHDIAYWGTETWQEQRRFVAHDTVQNLSMSADGRWLSSGGSDGFTKVWNVSSGELAMEAKDRDVAVLCTALSSDGRFVAAGGYNEVSGVNRPVTLFDRATGARVCEIWPGAQVWSLRFLSADTRLLIGAGNGECHEYDVSDPRFPRVARISKPHDNKIRSLEVLEDDSQLLTVSDDTRIQVSSMPERRLHDTISVSHARVAAFSPDGDRFALGHFDGGFAMYDRMGRLMGRSQITALDANAESFDVPTLAFDSKSTLWAAGISGNTIHFNVRTTSQETNTYSISHDRELTKVWLSNHAEHALTVDQANQAALWHLDGFTKVAEFAVPRRVEAVAFAQGNRTVAMATEFGQVLLVNWSHLPNSPLELSTETRHGLHSVALDQSGSLVAAADWEGIIYVWSIADGQLKHRLHHQFGTQEPVTDVLFSNDGRYLVSASNDFRLWDVGDGRLLKQLGPSYDFDKRYECAAFSPSDDCLIAVADQPGHGALHIWDTAPKQHR